MVDPTEKAVEDLSAAARELDRAVHREIFGGEVEPPSGAGVPGPGARLPAFRTGSGTSLPRYADRLSEAWRVVEYLAAGPGDLPSGAHDRLVETLREHEPRVFRMPEREAAETICRAALRAVRQESLTVRGKCPQCGEQMEQVGYRERPGDGRADEVYLCDGCGSEPTVFAPLPRPA